MSISATAVKELRERTGAGMMDCKKALAEVNGDFDQAIDWLRKKGLSNAAKKSGRVAAEGTVTALLAGDSKSAVLLEVNSETDFVARNEKFQLLVKNLASHALANKPATAEAMLTQKFASQAGKTVSEALTESVATIGENMVLRRLMTYEAAAGGIVSAYVHGEGRIGVLVEIEGSAAAASVAKDVAMHVAAVNPLCATADGLDPAAVAKERDVLKGKALESGKKPEMVDKIVEGQIAKWKSEVCLVNQKFVKNPDVTVGDFLKEAGNGAKIRRFVRFELGEGIEKPTSNFAEEVAAALKA